MNQSDASSNAPLNGMFSGATITSMQVVVVNGGAPHVHFHEAPHEKADAKPSPSEVIASEGFPLALRQAQPYFWAQSSWAVVYCVLRDRFGFAGSMRDFEHCIQSLPQPLGYTCPDDIVSKTIRTNPYMKLSIDKWTSATACKERVTRLADALTTGLREICLDS